MKKNTILQDSAFRFHIANFTGRFYGLFFFQPYKLYNMLTNKSKTLNVDIETYSDLPLTGPNGVGLYKYASHPSFEILLFAYSLDGGPAKCIDLKSGRTIPIELEMWLFDPTVIKKGWNITFELFCLSIYFKRPLPPEQWRCTMIKSAYNGLPMKLEQAGSILRLDKQKMSEGKDLIKYFTMPCKPTKRNGMRTRNLPSHEPDKWEMFKNYGMRDVDVEKAIDNLLIIDLPEQEKKLYAIDQHINRRGARVDLDLINKIIKLDTSYRAHLIDKAKEITGLNNPNSVKQLKEWLEEETDEYIPSLDSKNVERLKKLVPPGKAADILHIRRELAISSVKKYYKMLAYADRFGRIQGQFQFYGALTGRWAGRGVQLHNLTRNKIKYADLVYLRELVKSGASHEVLSWLYDSVSGSLKELIRPAIVPSPGYKLVVGDFTAIEAVVLAWLSNEVWRLNAFKQKKDIYIASASRMFHIDESKIDEDSPIRQRGKVSELSLGYGGAVGALIRMGALDMGLKEQELPGIVYAWRQANPGICKAWKTIEAAFKYALQNKGEVIACFGGRIKFQFYKGRMLMRLPSGRFLVYNTPELIDGELSYYGQNQTTKQWQKQHIYGGKLIENAVQAIARDLLGFAMINVHEKYQIVLHVHDEIGTEVPEEDQEASKNLERIMSDLPDWAKGMPIRAKVFETQFYRKG
jgi:DNA polymerase